MMTGMARASKFTCHKLTDSAYPSWKPVAENTESQFDSYIEQENCLNGIKIVDDRVHACLYFAQRTVGSEPASTFTLRSMRLSNFTLRLPNKQSQGSSTA